MPLAASSVRLIHNVISRALTAAVRWEWLPNNPTKRVRIPAKPVPDRRPPSAGDAARMIEEAWRQDKRNEPYSEIDRVTLKRTAGKSRITHHQH